VIGGSRKRRPPVWLNSRWRKQTSWCSSWCPPFP
jgi:hypothetical protein